VKATSRLSEKERSTGGGRQEWLFDIVAYTSECVESLDWGSGADATLFFKKSLWLVAEIESNHSNGEFLADFEKLLHIESRFKVFGCGYDFRDVETLRTFASSREKLFRELVDRSNRRLFDKFFLVLYPCPGSARLPRIEVFVEDGCLGRACSTASNLPAVYSPEYP
jgi:hypothetical protein